MIINKLALPRRTFLRGIGATLALPLLDAMVPAASALAKTAATAPRRLGYVYIPMGMNPVPWIPAEVGHLTTLSSSVAAGSVYRRHHRRDQPGDPRSAHLWKPRVGEFLVPDMRAP